LLAVSAKDVRSVGASMLAGCIAALSVTLMHFVGMAAIQRSVAVTYDSLPIAVAIVMSILLVGASFERFRRGNGKRRIIEAALLMIIGVFVLHFTAMSATTITPVLLIDAAPDNDVNNTWLVGAVFLVVCAIALATTAAAMVDRYLTDLKGFADAALEGLAVMHDGIIIEVNFRLSEMLGLPVNKLIGVRADALLIATDGASVGVPRPSIVEASPLNGGGQRFFEMAVNSIEFRGRNCQVLALLDLTEKKVAQLQIERLASYDTLTGLANRMLLQRHMDEAIARLGVSSEAIAVLALDLDRFKAVNDLYGHAAGDRVLISVADLLTKTVGDLGTVARLGGDEFIILQVDLPQPQSARDLAQRIIGAFETELKSDTLSVGVSIGIALWPKDAIETDLLLHSADLALYKAKAAGRGVFYFYTEAMNREVRDRRQLEADLRRALIRDELHVEYQPLVDAGCSLTGYEALLRWNHQSRGNISPSVFIPIAEDTGTILALGEWVLREACRTAAHWDDKLTVAVNVSPLQFQAPNLAAQVVAALKDSGLAPARLGLEITESVLIHDREKALEMLRRIKDLGVSIIMDDFGTGYSSLSSLQIIPFDKIKIDGSFIQSMEKDDSAKAIVRAVVGLGRNMNLPVVAEGVETEAQYRMAVEEGCSEIQGYYVDMTLGSLAALAAGA